MFLFLGISRYLFYLCDSLLLVSASFFFFSVVHEGWTSVEPSLTKQKQEHVRVIEMDACNCLLWTEGVVLVRVTVYINNLW